MQLGCIRILPLARKACGSNTASDQPSSLWSQELIERWSRPIFEQYRERHEDDEVRERELQMRQARAVRQKAQAASEAEQEAQTKVSLPILLIALGCLSCSAHCLLHWLASSASY